MPEKRKWIMNTEKVAPLVLRVGVGIVFLYFGITKFTQPDVWINWINPKILYYIPFTPHTFIYLQGALESLTGLMLIIGLLTRVFALIAFLIVAAILVSVGISDVTVRDIAILAAALSLALTKASFFSIDARISNGPHKKKPEKEIVVGEDMDI